MYVAYINTHTVKPRYNEPVSIGYNKLDILSKLQNLMQISSDITNYMGYTEHFSGPIGVRYNEVPLHYCNGD